jgi:CheY-like chemotaxis protein
MGTLELEHGVLPGRPVRVVVADDHEPLRFLLCELLTTEGYEVQPCASGYELADYLEERNGRPDEWPDIILADIRMPGHDGLKLLAALRTADWTTPVILMTGFRDPDVVATAMEHQAVTVLAKPFPVETLLHTIDDVVGLEYGPSASSSFPTNKGSH